jgi:hypothetical protein
LSEIHKLINSIRNKEELPVRWKESIIVPIYKNGDKTDCSNYRGISLISTLYRNVIQYPSFLIYMKLLQIISVGFDVTDQLLIRFFYIYQKLEKNENTVKWYSILIEFGVPMKPDRPI